MYAPISQQRRNTLADMYVNLIMESYRKEMLENKFYKYEAEIQGCKFVTCMSDEELFESVKLSIDLLEELKNMNNEKLDKEIFAPKYAKCLDEMDNYPFAVLGLWNDLSTPQLDKLVREIDRVRRVGGAWALIISNPLLYEAIFAVYEKIVDSFDDEDLYDICGFFLLRIIMKMHSDEIKENLEGNDDLHNR